VQVSGASPRPPNTGNHDYLNLLSLLPIKKVRQDREQEEAMNHSIYSADRRTHLKIVVVGLLSAAVVAFIGIFEHVSEIDLGTVPLIKASQSTALSGRLPTR
jgi:hypothetical protein